MEWEPIKKASTETVKEATGWQLQALQADREALEKATQAWKELAASNPPLTDACSEEDIEREASRIQESMTAVLNCFVKPIQVCPYSKHWWQAEIKLA